MGWFALATAAIALLFCATISPPLGFVGLGLAIAGIALGLPSYRRRQDPASVRLAGAGAMCVSIIALTVGLTKYGVLLLALQYLRELI